MKRTDPNSTSERLRVALAHTAQGGVLPFVAVALLAEEHGVSRTLVAHVRSSLGLRSVPRQTEHQRRSRYQCLCGEVSWRRELCAACRRIALPCTRCGVTVRRTPGQMIQSAKIQSGDTSGCSAVGVVRLRGLGRRVPANGEFARCASRSNAALLAAASEDGLPWGAQRRIARQFEVSAGVVDGRAEYLGLEMQAPRYRRSADSSH